MYRENLLDNFKSFVRVPTGYLRSWVGMLRGVGYRSVPTVGLARSQLSMFFSNVDHMITRD